MTYDLKDKVVLITGASSGIGAAASIALSKEGCKLILTSRNEGELQNTKLLCANSDSHAVYPLDVTNEEACVDAVKFAIERFGKLDVVVCNAGLTMRALAENTETKVFDYLMQVNFWGAFYIIQAAMPHLLQTKGMAVGVSSVSGFKALPGRSGYTASKHALNGYLECLRIENLKTGVHVLTFCPGFTATNIRFNALNASGKTQSETPRNEGKMMQPEEVASELVSAMRKKKQFKVLTKQGKIIYWIDKFAPRFISRKIFEEFASEPDSPLRTKPIN